MASLDGVSFAEQYAVAKAWLRSAGQYACGMFGGIAVVEQMESRLLFSNIHDVHWGASITARQKVFVSADARNQSITIQRGSVATIAAKVESNLVGGRIVFTVLSPKQSETARHAKRAGDQVRGSLRSLAGSSLLLVSLKGCGNVVVASAQAKAISIDGGAGHDAIQVTGDLSIPVTLLGGTGNDTIQGGARSDVIRGGKGDDWLSTRAHKSMLDGGLGDDMLFAGAGADTIYGGSGRDRLFRNGGDEVHGVELIV